MMRCLQTGWWYPALSCKRPTWFLMFCGLRMGRYSDTLSQLLPCRA